MIFWACFAYFWICFFLTAAGLLFNIADLRKSHSGVTYWQILKAMRWSRLFARFLFMPFMYIGYVLFLIFGVEMDVD